MGFFPLPFLGGAMTAEKEEGRFEIGLDAETGVREENGQRALKQRKGERLCAAMSMPSIA